MTAFHEATRQDALPAEPVQLATLLQTFERLSDARTADEVALAVGAFASGDGAEIRVVAKAAERALECLNAIEALERAVVERDRLVRELDHRVKNSLAAVRAIVQQTAKSAASPESFSQGFSERVMALSRAQDLIARAAGAGVRLADVVDGGVGAGARPRIEMGGPEVRLAAETAVNLLMGVHELAANALAHGSLAAADGRVEIDWRLEEGRFRFEWRELGGPPAPVPQAQGFGLRMLARALPRSLGGEASVDFGQGGIVYRLSAPLSAAIRSVGSD